MAPAEAFQAALLARVLTAAAENATGGGAARHRALRDAATRIGLTRRRFDPAVAADRLAELLPHCAGFGRTAARLADDASRELMLDVLAWRVLGGYHVSLPVSPADEERHRQRLAGSAAPGSDIPGPFGFGLPRHSYRGIELHVTTDMLVAFELGQYAPARPGDIVVDGGAGFGETALVYAQQVGPDGRVVAIELEPSNLAIIERNLALNPELAERITIVHGALWSSADADVEYGAMAGQSSVLGDGAHARSVTVDGLGLDRVDVLKLDVEAAEGEALRGAARTLARDRPRLEIAAYHRADDLAVLPALVDELEPAYALRLGHFTSGQAETILQGAA